MQTNICIYIYIYILSLTLILIPCSFVCKISLRVSAVIKSHMTSKDGCGQIDPSAPFKNMCALKAVHIRVFILYPKSSFQDGVLYKHHRSISTRWSYLPTPPLGQDMTQGQFLSGVQQDWIQSFPSPRLVATPRLKNLVCPTIYP